MSKPIKNQAQLEFQAGGELKSISSNIAKVTMQDSLYFSKNSLEKCYRINDTIIYSLMFQNISTETIDDIIITDNLGTNKISDTINVTPLTYVGPTQVFYNGILQPEIEPVIAPESITFRLSDVPPNAQVMLHYKVRTNNFAPADPASGKIINKALLTSARLSESIESVNELSVDQYADVSILKTMSPEMILSGGAITYNFEVKNAGNQPAEAMVLKDTFTQVPKNISVTVNGTPTSDFTFEDGTFQYPRKNTTNPITLPAADIKVDESTGRVDVIPSEMHIMINGYL